MEKKGIRWFNLNGFGIFIGNKVSNINSFNNTNDIDNINKASSSDIGKSKDYSFTFHGRILTLILLTLWGATSCFFIITGRTGIGLWNMLIGALVFVLIQLCVSCWQYRSSRKQNASFDKSKLLSDDCCKDVLFFASPSMFFASMFKRQFKAKDKGKWVVPDKSGLTKLIAQLNGCNVLMAGIIALITVAITIANSFIIELRNIDILRWGFGVFTTFVVVRTLSRSFEITYAFGKDATDGKIKDSLLDSHDRLLLAITSLVECIMNYSVAYYLVSFYSVKKDDIWHSFVGSFQSGLFYSNSFLSDCQQKSVQSTLSMLQLTQVLTCMTLVFLAFAIYISDTTSSKSKNK